MEKVIISGNGTETTPVTGSLVTLSIQDGASVSVESSLTIEELVDSSRDDVCKLKVLAGNTLTASAMGKSYV